MILGKIQNGPRPKRILDLKDAGEISGGCKL